MINYPNPCKSSIGEYTSDELHQIVVEELPKLRAIAELSAEIVPYQTGVYYTEAERRIGQAIKEWQDCIGSQLDARNG